MQAVALALLCAAAPRVSAQVFVHGSGNGTVDNPYVLAQSAGSFHDGSGTASYGPSESKWWRISPCVDGQASGRACEVLLWFDSFDTTSGHALRIFDGLEPPQVDADGVPVDDCSGTTPSYPCLAQFSGPDVGSQEPRVLVRSTSPVIWLYWATDEGVQAPGFEAQYKTDRSHNGKLKSIVMVYPDAAGGGSLQTVPPFNQWLDERYYYAQLETEKTAIELTVLPDDAPAWTPWEVTHPLAKAGQEIEPVTIYVNGLPYMPAMHIGFEMEILEQPVAISVVAMDGETIWDYTITVSPNARDLEEEQSPNATTGLMPVATVPAPRQVDIHAEGWRPANIYGGTVTVVQGEILVFDMANTVSASGGTVVSQLWRMTEPGCPLPHVGEQLNPCAGDGCLVSDPPSPEGITVSHFLLEMKDVGTFYFAGSHDACQTHGQQATVTVAASLSLQPNTHATAKNLTHVRIAGANLTRSDQPWITGTQWDSVPVTSLAGWDGFHEWFRFNAHTNEKFNTSVVLNHGMYYAVGTIWDAGGNILMGNVTNACAEDPCPSPRGPRGFQLNWTAPITGLYYLAIRSYVTSGSQYGNYTVSSDSDWIDLCIAEGLNCGKHGTCEIVEGPVGNFRPVCACLHRWHGTYCELEPVPPLVILIDAKTTIHGAVGKDDIKQAIASSVHGVEESMVNINTLSQRVSGVANLPGSVDEYNNQTTNGTMAQQQLLNGLMSVFQRGFDGCASCVARILDVSDYLVTHGLRAPAFQLSNGSNDTLHAALADDPSQLAEYWPDPDDPSCYANRCFDPDCLDADVSSWRPWGLDANPLPVNGDQCSGGIGLSDASGAIEFVADTDSDDGVDQPCTWLIQCLGGAVQLNISTFGTETADLVQIQDGNGTNAVVLAELNGQLADLTQRSFVSSTSYMQITLDRNVAGVSAVFGASYSCTAAPSPPVVCTEICGPNPNLTSADRQQCDSLRPDVIGRTAEWCTTEAVCANSTTSMDSGNCCATLQACEQQQPPPPPVWGRYCDELVQQAIAVGLSCSARVSRFMYITPENATLTLSEACPVSCGSCRPYLGAASVAVKFEIFAAEELSKVALSGEFSDLSAQAIDEAGVFVWGNQTLHDSDFSVGELKFESAIDYVVSVAKATSVESKATSRAVQQLLTGSDGQNFAQAMNGVLGSGAVAGTNTASLEANAGVAADAVMLASEEMLVATKLAALAADGDSDAAKWDSDQAGADFVAQLDAIHRVYETAQAQRDAVAAAGALVAGGAELGANGLTTVALAAEEAENYAASVLGLDLQIGENIQNGFETYVHDVSRGGEDSPADFMQFGDESKATVAAAASAAAAKLVAEGADDAHPLDHLAPILSQAPSSQAFSADIELPSSTSRFSAQTQYWWIPDYLPGGRPPEQPDPPVVSSYDSSRVRISWDAPFDWGIPIVGYVVEMRSCEIFYQTQSASECDGPRTDYEPVFPTHEGVQTYHEIQGLQAGRMYFFHVRAYNVFDQYMRPNNYGVFSYDSLAVTLWRVADKIDAPIVHKVECQEAVPKAASFGSLDRVAHHVSDDERLRSRANCSVRLTWVEPFSGAVENPLVHRDSVLQNSILNYRIFYHASPLAPPLYPAPATYVDQSDTTWVEVPQVPDLRYCETDYTEVCPEKWSYSEDVETEHFVCTKPDDPSVNMSEVNVSSPCYGSRTFDYNVADKIAWESECNTTWAQRCNVRTEATITGLEDTTEYFFIVTAVNRGRPGATAGLVRNVAADTVFQGGNAPKSQVWGEGDFSDPSLISSAGVITGERILAQDRLQRIAAPAAPETDGKLQYPGSRVPLRSDQPASSHSPEDGPLQLEGVWYYPATVIKVNDLDTFTVEFDQDCPGLDGEMMQCIDEYMTRDLIDTLGTSSRPSGVVTWRVPDAPAAPTFGTITETSVEVHWNPPVFDGNTNHEVQYADPVDTASGGIVNAYRLFMARYDDSSGLREKWVELDVAFLGTNTTHVVTNLDSDVVYIFTVIASNVVGDSAHSQESEAPITLEAPIPEGTVAVSLRPLCPEVQPRFAQPAPHWLACTNLPSSLLAITAGGGANAIFDWTLWQEYVEITTVPSVYSTEEVWVESPVEDDDVLRALVLNGFNVTVFQNGSGIHHTLEILEVLTTNSSQSSAVRREKILDLGTGGNDCCTLTVPDGNYLLVLNSSNTRGWVVTEEVITLKKCGCMDIFNSEFDGSARHHAPFMCDSHTFEGAEKMVVAGAFNHYEHHLSDSIFAVELSMVIESGNIDVYTSTSGLPQLNDNYWDTAFYNVSAVDHSIIAWEYRVPFNILMVTPEPGVRGHQYQFIDTPKSLYIGVLGDDDFSRYSVRVRNVKFQEERINLPDWEATNDMVESGRYKFYELHFSESGADMDVKVSVQCKVGNVTLFIAKKDKYPSEFRTFTQTATTAAEGLAEVIDTWRPEEDRVVFIAVRGNDGGYTEGYPNAPTLVNEFIVTARSYRYRAETIRLRPTVANSSDTSLSLQESEKDRYTEIALDNFNFYEVAYSDAAYAIEAVLAVSYGVVDLYTSFDAPPTQGRYYQRAAGLHGNVTIQIPFDAVGSGIGSVFLGVLGRETDFSNYAISVREFHLHDASKDPTTLQNGTWLTGMTSPPRDGYRFYRSYVGPEDIPMGHDVRSGPGSRAANPGTDPATWGTDWREEWIQTWTEHHRDEYDFDVYATVTVKVYPAAIDTTAENHDSVNSVGQLADSRAAGVSVFASLNWKYPAAERARDAETHRLGGTDEVTVATLTLPVWTFYGRTMYVGVRTEDPNAVYDIQVTYQVQFEQDLTAPVAKPHQACPTVPVLMGHPAAEVTMDVACNGHGACVDGRCHCETGFVGEDCSTVAFADGNGPTTLQPRITLLSPAMGAVLDQSPVNLSFAVANRVVPAHGRVLLYVDGRPYPKKHSNILSDLTDFRLYGLYRGRHTAKLVLVTSDGSPLTTDMVHFVVEKPGGCAGDCNRRGICMDGAVGQYCICNDGWVGTDCAVQDLWRSGQKFYAPAGGLAADLSRQLDHTLSHGLQQSELEMAALQLALATSAESVQERHRAAEQTMNTFRNQMEDDMHTLKLEHETMLETLYRNRDRVQLDSEQQSEMLRRTISVDMESRHERVRALDANQQRVQNRMDRLRRSHDMRFALMNDEFEYSRAKLHSGVDAIRAFDTAGGKKINELEKSECVQSADGNFECFQMSHIRDPETGELQVSPSR